MTAPKRRSHCPDRRAAGTGCGLDDLAVPRDDAIETLSSSVWQPPDGRWQTVFHPGTQAACDDKATP